MLLTILKSYGVWRYWHKQILLLMGIILSLPLNAQTKLPDIDLQEAIRRTLLQNPSLHQFEFRQARQLGQAQTDALAPALALSVAFENFAGSGQISSADSLETTVALSSVIELGGQRKKRVAVNHVKQVQLEFQQKSLTLDILAQLTEHFIRGTETQALLALALDTLTLKREALDIVRTRSSKGATPEIDVKKTEVAVIQAELYLQELLAQHERDKALLVSFWGASRVDFNQFNSDLSIPPLTRSFEDIYQQALNSPSMTVYTSQRRLEDANLRLVRSQSKRDVEWQLGIRQFQHTGDAGLVFGLSVPLNPGKRNQGAIKSAMADKLASEEREAQAKIRLYQQLYKAYSLRQQYANSAKKIDEDIIPILETSLHLTQKAYAAGRYRYQEWFDAQHALLTAKHRLITNRAQALMSQTVIEQLTGQNI